LRALREAKMSELRDRSARGLDIEKAQFTENTCGFEAVDYKVFVKKDTAKEKSSGGIIFANDLINQEAWTIMTGVIVSLGSFAFTEGGEDWPNRPTPGTRVMVKEYAGSKFVGKDGETYYVFTDKDISGVEL
jgi:co-chaperonin GroES (HSP10)